MSDPRRDEPGRCMLIAEAGVNHDGVLERALELIDVAAHAQADVVKFQTFAANRLAIGAARKASYQVEQTGDAEGQLDMLRALELRDADFEILAKHAGSKGIEFMSTPFDDQAVDLLERIQVARYKIGSGEITNHPLLERVGSTGKPVILSTGMSYLGEVEAAVRILDTAGCSDLTLLHCTSNYPADYAEVNLRAMQTLHRAFGVPVGLSDHTPGIEVACAAVALGASVIEKHFTLDRTAKGPDHASSLEPEELCALVRSIHHVEIALGDGIKRPRSTELDTREVARKSLVAAHPLPRGTRLKVGDLVAKRPGLHIPPCDLARVLGRRLNTDLATDEPLDWEHLCE